MSYEQIIKNAFQVVQSGRPLYRSSMRGDLNVPPAPVVHEAIKIDYSYNRNFLLLCSAGVLQESGINLLRFLGSALLCLTNSTGNPTGSRTPPTEIKIVEEVEGRLRLIETEGGLGPINGVIIDKKFVTLLEDAHINELAAFLGNCFHALGKALGENNFPAFLENRIPAVKGMMSTDPEIFVPGSKVITRDLITKINSVSLAYPNVMGRLIMYMADQADNLVSGPGTSFTGIAGLLNGHGYTAMMIIFTGLKIAPHLVKKISGIAEYVPDFVAAVEILQKQPHQYQGLLKVIHQNRYVPIQPGNQLAAAYWLYLSDKYPSWGNYEGLRPDSKISSQIINLMTEEEAESDESDKESGGIKL